MFLMCCWITIAFVSQAKRKTYHTCLNCQTIVVFKGKTKHDSYFQKHQQQNPHTYQTYSSKKKESLLRKCPVCVFAFFHIFIYWELEIHNTFRNKSGVVVNNKCI